LIGESLHGEVTLAHAPPSTADAAALKGVLDCSIRFNGRENSINFESRLLQRPLCLPYAQLARLLENHAVALFPLRGQCISSRLEMLMRKALEASAPIPHAGQIARRYGKSGPTLRRRLVQEGTTFRSMHNKCRMERAAELLSNTNLTVEQIARRVNFSTASGFSRAFKGWTGAAPTQCRAPRPDAAARQKPDCRKPLEQSCSLLLAANPSPSIGESRERGSDDKHRVSESVPLPNVDPT
jgi:AraC-like DNA-binding protein